MKKTEELLIKEVKRRICDESIPRIIGCIEMLSEVDLYYRPNEQCNSINNQVLHLEGNVRQWLLSAALDQEDKRNRAWEFNVENKISKEELIVVLQRLRDDILFHMHRLSEKDLTEVVRVQCYDESLISILVHVIEHFSYHTGQIALLTKILTQQDLEFYSGHNLDQNN